MTKLILSIKRKLSKKDIYLFLDLSLRYGYERVDWSRW